MPFAFNGSTASLAPYQQTWQDIVLGRDHTGRPVYAATKNVQLQFDACTQASYNQWQQLHGASLTSVQLLNLDGTSFVTYQPTGLFMEIADRPTFEAGHVGRWSVLIHGIQVS